MCVGVKAEESPLTTLSISKKYQLTIKDHFHRVKLVKVE